MLTLSSHMVFLSPYETRGGVEAAMRTHLLLFLQKLPQIPSILRHSRQETLVNCGPLPGCGTPWLLVPSFSPHSRVRCFWKFSHRRNYGALVQLWEFSSIHIVSCLRLEPEHQVQTSVCQGEGSPEKPPEPSGLVSSSLSRLVRVTAVAMAYLLFQQVEACASKSSRIISPDKILCLQMFTALFITKK